VAGCGEDGGSSDSFSLDEKLARQFDLYEPAQQAIVQRVAADGGTVLRAEWESWLSPPPAYRFSDVDLTKLRDRQARVIAESRRRAAQASVVDLNRIRAAGLVDEYCRELPKGGMLHIHPSGTRDRDTIEELLIGVNPIVDGLAILQKANNGMTTMLYPDEIEFLRNLPVMHYLDYTAEKRRAIHALFFLPDDPPTHPFERFEAVFSISEVLSSDASAAAWVDEKTALDFLTRAAAQGVTSVEFTDDVSPTPAILDRLRAQAADWLARTGVVVRWNLAFDRTLDPGVNAQIARQLIALVESNPHDELVGIDLLAKEDGAPALETGQQIYGPVLAANEMGRIALHRTMHAGEHGLVMNSRDAMIIGSERLGHGVRLFEDPISVEYTRLIVHLPIEINLWSNYRLQVVDSFEHHPFLPFLRLGLPVSLSTDDEGIFGTDISNECVIAINHTDITHAELKAMSFNSLATSFAAPDIRSALTRQLEADFQHFEETWEEVALDPAA